MPDLKTSQGLACLGYKGVKSAKCGHDIAKVEMRLAIELDRNKKAKGYLR